MGKLKPKQCVNSNCKVVMYIPAHRMHLPLQCDDCIDRRRLVLRKGSTRIDVAGELPVGQERTNTRF